MADKTTTLTTQTGDSIYPNVLDENIPDTIARVSDVNNLKTNVETAYLTQANAEATYQTKAGRADYVSKTYGDGTYATITQLGGKQDKLTAGSNITIEGTTIAAVRPENRALYGDLAATNEEFTGGGSGGGGGTGSGGTIPVVEGTASTTTTEGAYATYTIPAAQTSCFIFKCDLGTAFVSYNAVFETYNGYLDAEGDVADDNLKLSQLIVLSGSGTKIDIFLGRLGGDGGSGSSASLPIIQATPSGTIGDAKTYTIPAKQTSPFILSIDNNYVFINVSTNGNDYYGEYYYEYKYYYISGGNTSILLRENTSFVLGSKSIPLFTNYNILVDKQNSKTEILPCTASDNGKVLSVVNGEAQWAKGFEYDTITIDEKKESYTGTITGGKPVYDTSSHGFLQGVVGTLGVSTGVSIESSEHGSNDVYSLVQNIFNQNMVSHRVYYIQPRTYFHFIILSSNTLGQINFNYYDTRKEQHTIDTLKTALKGRTVSCSGYVDDGGTKKIATYIEGASNGSLSVGWFNISDGSTGRTTLDSTITLSDTVKPVE